MNIDYIFKIVVLGDSGVGKTSFIHKLNHSNHCKDSSTIGVDFSVFITKINNKNIKIQIWDTAGQEQFRSITKSYFRNVAGALVFFDVSNINSFLHIEQWVKDLKECGVVEESIACIANKTDLIHVFQYKDMYNDKIHIYNNSFDDRDMTKSVFQKVITRISDLYESKDVTKGVSQPISVININAKHSHNKRCYSC